MDNNKVKSERNPKWQRVSWRTLLCVSFAPWLNLAAWTAWADAARHTLGHYPHGMTEIIPPYVDYVLGPFSLLTLLLLVLSVPAWIFMIFWNTWRWKGNNVWRAIVVYGLGWASTILINHLDPVGFLSWFYG